MDEEGLIFLKLLGFLDVLIDFARWSSTVLLFVSLEGTGVKGSCIYFSKKFTVFSGPISCFPKGKPPRAWGQTGRRRIILIASTDRPIHHATTLKTLRDSRNQHYQLSRAQKGRGVPLQAANLTIKPTGYGTKSLSSLLRYMTTPPSSLTFLITPCGPGARPSDFAAANSFTNSALQI
jgi:hypothetical protein